jgi:hypothetical protein
MEFGTSENTRLKKKFEPKGDEIGRKVGALSIEKLGDSFISSDL